jgi:hypothetical protein
LHVVRRSCRLSIHRDALTQYIGYIFPMKYARILQPSLAAHELRASARYS